MGIFDWVTSKTGVWGPALLDLYFQNAGWINTIVIAYGLLLLLSWQYLSRVCDALVDQILEQAMKINVTGKKGKQPKMVYLSDFQLSWERAFASSRFPFVAKQAGIVIRLSSLENIRALISDRDLVQRSYHQLAKMGIQMERNH
jgi:hypothetical protein